MCLNFIVIQAGYSPSIFSKTHNYQLLASACWMDFLLLGHMFFTLTLACLVENVYFRNVMNLLKRSYFEMYMIKVLTTVHCA